MPLPATIRRAYRQQLLRIHLDRRPVNQQAAAHAEMTRLNLACETLSDDGRAISYFRTKPGSSAKTS